MLNFKQGSRRRLKNGKSQDQISMVKKKSFFQTSTRLLFWPLEFFLHVFYQCYAYISCLLELKQTFSTNYSITRPVEMIRRQEKAIFVGFYKMMLRWSHEGREWEQLYQMQKVHFFSKFAKIMSFQFFFMIQSALQS